MDSSVESENVVIAIEEKLWCRKHHRVGRWKVVHFYEDLGGGVLSLVDSADVIECEACR